MKILLVEVNISEGRDGAKIEQIKESLMVGNDIEIIDLNSDKDHNRSVFTYKGECEAVLDATKRLSKKAIELIDMTKHRGSHPRMGAVDVVPFIPILNMTGEEAVEISKEYGRYMGSLGVPVYYYEDSAIRDDRKSLVKIRKGQYEALADKMKDESWKPDEGPFEFNPKSGATVVGSRFALLAFNINLDTEDLEIGNKIATAIRGSSGGYQHVRAIALEIPDRKMIQVSMNLTNYEKTPIHRVYETIKFEASRYNVNISDTELVGPVPVYALRELLDFYIRLKDFSTDQIYF
ncbi:glutamate formiminotransferase [Alkalibaculum bacchi]|uniref:glutamate formimidoyltransferase n=1 Tax=Alkalibaculum bacchi TaxID=645887 RepID=A0A366I342_9FIRM|nr:glutamate formimidoyltransferase [Alkalibaculum bacchi]RBP61369.1 glutamate formiminotransferase [Alkalibaculum bacchi]